MIAKLNLSAENKLFVLRLRGFYSWLLVVLWLLLFASCTGLRSLSEGKHLYTGKSLEIDSAKVLVNSSDTREELEDLFSKHSNRKVLWMRPLLCLHKMIAEPKNEKGFWHWIKYKLGEAPVYLEDINFENINLGVENVLQNRGHFLARSVFEVDSGRKTASVHFKVFPGPPYTLKSITYPLEQDGIAVEVSKLKNQSTLKPGDVYNLKAFENERNRIDSALKENGYYFFNSDYLLFLADTTVSPQQVVVRLKLKSDMPQIASVAYKMNDINILDDYSILNYHPDTTLVGNYHVLSVKNQYRPEVILNELFLQKDSLYSRNEHYKTIKHLMGIGVYKSVIAKFFPDSVEQEKMNVNILLSPHKKISLSAEMSAAIKTTGFAGPGLKLSYKDKNLLHGAELFTVSLGGNFETQLKGNTKGQTSYQVTLDASLTLPKFVPFKLVRKDVNSYFPKTTISAGIGIYSRVNLYDLRSFNTSLGYSWKVGNRISQFFKLIDISYTRLANTTAEFEDYLNENPNIRKSFEEQFVLGGGYTFIYSGFNRNNKKHHFYLAESIDYSGNIATLIANMTHSIKSNDDTQYELLGVPYSQFIRIKNEGRYFYDLTKTSKIGMRLIVGGGVPYTNSTTMPYNKQYFSGGPSSIRAFLSRSIGPGTYIVPDSLSTVSIDQAGDLLLESSLEYRFDIIKSFKGALFADAGNIWLVNDDPQRAGGRFNINTFYTELAVGSGFGLRFDFTFIIVRFDVAFPLRKPWLPDSEKWVIDKIAFGSSSWRNENVILNFAIGYPF